MTPHPLYRAPGADGTDRQAAYRELFRCELEAGVVDAIRQATNRNFALGDERFGDQIAQAWGRRVRASALEHHNAGNPNMFMRTSSSQAARLRFKRKLHFFLSVLSR
ncbi:MAG: hypothetical protein KBF41_07890, partial [Azonexus sp.]|nr:hypothetical protein [Azonexus sp.]